jgi:hypothetical protein
MIGLSHIYGRLALAFGAILIPMALSRYPLRGPWFGFSFGCVETDLVNASRRRLPTKSLDRSHARQFHQGANGVLTIAQRTVQAMPRH